MTWELKGKYPSIFEDKNVGTEAKKLFNDANNNYTINLKKQKDFYCMSSFFTFFFT